MSNLIDKVFDNTYPGLQKALELTWKRNQALTSNIANAETPQYRAVELNFAGELQRAFEASDTTIHKTNEKHMDLGESDSSHFVQDYSGATKPDGNNVDIDLQMGKLASNSGAYASVTRLLRKKLGLLKMAIREGGR